MVVLGKGALDALDIELEIGVPPQGNVSGTLVVANHVSWLDIFAMSAVYPSSFYCQSRKSAVGRFWGKWVKMPARCLSTAIPRRDIEPINQADLCGIESRAECQFLP